MHMPTFSKVWNTTLAATPKHTSAESVSPERRPTWMQRMTIATRSTSTRHAPIMPSSSPMKSVCWLGMEPLCVWVPSPSPVPVSPPEPSATSAWCCCQLTPSLFGSMDGSYGASMRCF